MLRKDYFLTGSRESTARVCADSERLFATYVRYNRHNFAVFPAGFPTRIPRSDGGSRTEF